MFCSVEDSMTRSKRWVFFSHITSFSDFPSGLPPSYFSNFPPWIAIEFIICSWTKIGDDISHKTQLPSEPSHCLWCVQFFEWTKCKETLLKDFLKSCFSFITGDLTNITVACYTRKSSLEQRPIKKATLISDYFFSSNCLTSYCSYKYKFKAVGLLSNITLKYTSRVFTRNFLLVKWGEKWILFVKSHQRDFLNKVQKFVTSKLGVYAHTTPLS